MTGATISHYSIVALVGCGGMGKVYLARDARTGRDVAIKVLRQAPADGHTRQGLAGEARMLSRLDHANVARVCELVSERGVDFLVMEFVHGPTVRQLLAAGALPSADVIRLGRQMARGLGAVHRACVVHRDIKPENLKVAPCGTLKILDFGVAIGLPRATIDLSTTIGELGLAGTVAYMSPEQLRGEEVDERSDVYSAGAVLYEMASGRRAFAERQPARLIDAILHDPPPSVARLNADVRQALAAAIDRALRKNPIERQQSAGELEEELEEATCATTAWQVTAGMTLAARAS